MYHSNPLCCCEYYDQNNERNHILACCCNCQDLDETFESLVTCSKISPKNKLGMMMTIQDRIRIPWKGGAKQITLDAILPIIIITLSLMIASIDLSFTIIVGTILLTLMFYTTHTLPLKIPHTKFFFIWTCFSLVILYVTFEYYVVPLLEILPEEDIAVGVCIVSSIVCVYMMKKRTALIQSSEGLPEEKQSSSYHCKICNITIPDGDYHSYWLDCCIGPHNQALYFLAKFFAFMALMYSGNLALTTICHPTTVLTYFLVPDDCSDVYMDSQIGFSFVCACYSLVLSVFILISLLHQMLLISCGITQAEWREAKGIGKWLYFPIRRSNSRGFKRNWSITCKKSFKKKLVSYNTV